jgi:hypothetical protein
MHSIESLAIKVAAFLCLTFVGLVMIVAAIELVSSTLLALRNRYLSARSGSKSASSSD